MRSKNRTAIAEIAQLAEPRPRNADVAGSIPALGSRFSGMV